MKLHAISKLTFFEDHPTLDWFHGRMFHGGELLPFRNDDPRVLPPPRPVRLWKNLYQIADVFVPATSGNLVVSRRVRERLETLPNVAFLPVEFARAFIYLCEPGDFSHHKRWRNPMNAAKFIESVPHDPDAAAAADTFYEVIIPRTVDVAPRYSDLQHFELVIGPTEWDDPISLDVSPKVLEDFPITWNSGFILSDRAMDLLEPFIDWRYFLRWPPDWRRGVFDGTHRTARQVRRTLPAKARRKGSW